MTDERGEEPNQKRKPGNENVCCLLAARRKSAMERDGRGSDSPFFPEIRLGVSSK